ncbi:uncharacterized protein PITG_03529 [Phytophthora infestans T30-4]|uniref:Single-strand DNA deaminase toxin A-like C-terminal domain-containing protein n=1 Tax=Phytophthora infestans (strain T30-4) TaxID=403677 RepID=D0MXU6_PHYIT|nr:uncharacterized protein PITG_03529 [Phytophthora infestans T30-4]EEY65994.1 conserved hypothetical protein [Phytophthora infestans T30-4]|eukprot:XP_002906593.1 conserved hypothetical protein [Phytophthora infestans T30-4]
MELQTQPPTAVVAPRYFSFKDFLTEAEAAVFFELPHAEQVVKVTQYLDFLGQQPDSAQFTTSSKASISFAKLREGMDKLLEGRTRSGFGAFGTDLGFLSQKRLSIAVAHIVEKIGHKYIVERNKRGIVKPPVLNSRSFYFYWCHAEKQKLMDIREKLESKEIPLDRRWLYWQHIAIVVDRAMCEDCIQFAECFARAEKACICIQDPEVARVFPLSSNQRRRIQTT